MGPSPLTRGSHDAEPGRVAVLRSIPAHAGQPRALPRRGGGARVHPRSRGAARPPGEHRGGRSGPSPLTRGSHAAEVLAVARRRSIPAHAGQPTVMGLLMVFAPVHPRSRGAASRPRRSPTRRRGPSPLTRGSHRQVLLTHAVLRSIPAHAGQPIPPEKLSARGRVHPRSRGAAAAVKTTSASTSGPSPLTRGSRGDFGGSTEDRGSIPAHAGQPAPRASGRPGEAVHPRSRGAADDSARVGFPIVGPSPLTRGSPLQDSQHGDCVRSIPAHAGQPSPPPPSAARARVHPRSRGAAGSAVTLATGETGPSPLTRGSLVWAGPARKLRGSIPAHAGQPGSESGATSSEGVHPRSRGAAEAKAASGMAAMGPSPLTRGSHRHHEEVAHGDGSIPAHAGQPP